MSFTRDLSTVFGSTRPWKGSMQNYTASFEIDFSLSGYSLAQNQVMRICTVPAGVAITSAMVKVITAETEITDIDIGIATDTNTSANLFDGISLASTGFIASNNLTVTNGGTYTTATNNLSLTNKDAQTLDAAKIVVIINFVDFAQAIV